jgi:hypothetical protein
LKSQHSGGISFYRIARWIVLFAFVFVIIAALRKPLPVSATLPPDQVAEKAKQFESKLADMQQARQRGDALSDIHFSADEVNSFVAEASRRSAQSTDGDAPTAPQVSFVGNEVIAQTQTARYGQDIYITMRGHVGATDGYLTFVPTTMQVGRLSVPVSLINSTLQKKLAEPENRAKLRLPDFIADLQVEDTQLVVRPK